MKKEEFEEAKSGTKPVEAIPEMPPRPAGPQHRASPRRPLYKKVSIFVFLSPKINFSKNR